MTTPPRLHLVTNNHVLSNPYFDQVLTRIAPNPNLALHLRGSDLASRRILELGEGMRRSGHAVFVNDRADIAATLAATGVHLPEKGLPVLRVRELFDRPILVGKSTHSTGDAAAALDEGADYVFLGPIWPTRSHPGTPGLGTRALEQLAGRRVIAIGGVDGERAAICADAGAFGVAFISAVWDAPNPGRVLDHLSLSFSDNG